MESLYKIIKNAKERMIIGIDRFMSGRVMEFLEYYQQKRDLEQKGEQEESDLPPEYLLK